MTAPATTQPDNPPAGSQPTTTPGSGSQPSSATSPSATPPAAPAAPAPKSPFAGLSDAEKDRLLSVYSGTIRDQTEQIKELSERMKTVETRTAPQPPDMTKRNQEFFNRPVEATQEIVRAEVQAAVAPLVDLIKSGTPRDQYTEIKERLRASPKVKEVLDTAERHVDELIRAHIAKGGKVTEDVVTSVIAGVRGAVELGWLDVGTSPTPSNPPANPNPNPNRPSMITPPHLRPSAPPAPSGNEPPKLRDLTEQEERLRRENKMTKEEFLAALDMAASDVVKVDKWPKREGGSK